MLTRYLLPLVAVVAFGFAIVQMTKAQQKPPPATPPVEPARSPYAKQLAGAGIVEPETENIAIGTHLPGVVEQVLVKVGDTVRPGKSLFRLDGRQLAAELEVRQAMLANAEAQGFKLDAAPRPEEVPPARAKVAEAEAMLRDQSKMYERLKPLAGTAAVSDDEFTRRELGVEAAKALLAKAKADLALIEAGTWKFDKLLAAAAVKQATAQVAQTRTEIDRLTVNAPRGGAEIAQAEYKVLQVNVRPGEYVAAAAGQPLVILGHVGQLHVRVDIDENDIGRFRPNLPGVAKPRGTPGVEFPIKFVRVEPYVIPKKSLTGGSLERVDTRVLQVIYQIDTTGKPLYVGQQMDVFLDAGE